MADGIIITAEINSDAWETAINHLEDIIRVYTQDASMDAAEYIGSIAKGKLHEREHGPLTFSPSPIGAGQPPATVSGALSDSIIHVPWGTTGAMVGPTTEYGRIQELGGKMEGHPYMRFMKAQLNAGGRFSVYRDGHRIFTGKRRGNDHYMVFLEQSVELTARPYLEPSTNEAVDSGRVREIYKDWWADAIEAGAG